MTLFQFVSTANFIKKKPLLKISPPSPHALAAFLTSLDLKHEKTLLSKNKNLSPFIFQATVGKMFRI